MLKYRLLQALNWIIDFSFYELDLSQVNFGVRLKEKKRHHLESNYTPIFFHPIFSFLN